MLSTIAHAHGLMLVSMFMSHTLPHIFVLHFVLACACVYVDSEEQAKVHLTSADVHRHQQRHVHQNMKIQNRI